MIFNWLLGASFCYVWHTKVGREIVEDNVNRILCKIKEEDLTEKIKKMCLTNKSRS